jgi:hypothetical protein
MPNSSAEDSPRGGATELTINEDVRGERCQRCNLETRRHVTGPLAQYCSRCDMSYPLTPESPAVAKPDETLRELALAATPWRCFHCDEVFTERADALAHFGSGEWAEAACVEKRERGLVESLRAAEGRNHELLSRAQEAESEAEGYAGLRADLKRYFGVSDAWTIHDRTDCALYAVNLRVTELEAKCAALRASLAEEKARLLDADIRVAELETLNAAHASTIESLNKRLPEFADLHRRARAGDTAVAALAEETARLDWWFRNGLTDSVCEGSVDLWWADDQHEVERVTHGVSVRDALDKAMRGIHEPDDAARLTSTEKQEL